MSAPPCPNATMWNPSCKKRSCPVCGVRWARNVWMWMKANLESSYRENRRGERLVNSPTFAIVSITAPGSDQLPWDRERCRHGPTARCSGTKYGCRVQDRALREWADTLSLRWGWLRRAARQAVDRAGFAPPAILLRVYEPQKRGAPHMHLVLPFGTVLERWAAQKFADELARLAPSYAFGFVDTRLQAHDGAAAARYLTAYLTGRSAKKNSIRENIADPRLPRSLIWLTPELTRVTFVTMRILRRARHIWAYLDGRCDVPVWRDRDEQIRANAVFARLMLRGPPKVPHQVRYATGTYMRKLKLPDEALVGALESIRRAEGIVAFA